MRPVIQPDDLIAAVFAFHVPYRDALLSSQGLPASRVETELLAVDHPALQLGGIYVSGPSGGRAGYFKGMQRLINLYGSVRVWLPGNDLTWGSVLPPREYYAMFIKPHVNSATRDHIDDLVAQLPR